MSTEREIPPLQRKGVHIKTFGCQMNVYDSRRLMAKLVERGYEEASDIRNAQVVLLNTCTIRDKAEHKVLSLLGELKGIKEKKNQILGVTGCVAQRVGRTLLDKVPHLDLVLGPDRIDEIGKYIEQIESTGARILDTKLSQNPKERQYSQPMAISRPRPSEYLTVMKGCDHFCTYCIVPFVRGREQSRPILEILQDVKQLSERGTKEVVFVGQNINTYGKGTEESLAELIEKTHEIEGISRIRYITSHPKDLSDDLISQFGSVPKLCPALHLPFQAGSDRILKEMGRLYTQRDYLLKIEKLKKACPGIALSTDVIVGFPGETDSEFQETLNVLEEVRFSSAFLFQYSPRPGTRASKVYGREDQIPEPIKKDRLLQAQITTLRHIDSENKSYVGTLQDCLIEGIDKKNINLSGRTPTHKVVNILNLNEEAIGKILSVRITHASPTSLMGTPAALN